MSKCSKKKRKESAARKILMVLLAVIVCLAVTVVILWKVKYVEQNTEADDQSGVFTIDENNDEEKLVEKQKESVEVEVVDDTGKVEIIEKTDASYEMWMAAAMVTAISMQYDDFTIDDIYLTGDTSIESKTESQGVYVVFTTGEGQFAVNSRALDAERVDTGTVDLYTRDLGFATFDMVDITGINTESCIQVTMDDLGELISQSLLVSLYEH